MDKLLDRGWLLGNRTRGPSHFDLNTRVLNYIDGLLLSDASISFHGNGARLNQTACFQHKDWLWQINMDFAEFGILSRIRPKTNSIWGIGDNKWSLDTLSYHELVDMRYRWYPNGIKVIPDCLFLSPISAMNLYLGDGSLDQDRRTSGCIQLSTESFMDGDVYKLGEIIKRSVPISRVNYGDSACGTGKIIRIQRRDDIRRFLAYANSALPIPVSFLYKFDYNGGY